MVEKMPKFVVDKDVKTLLVWGFLAIKSLLLGIVALLLYIRSGDVKKIEKIEAKQTQIGEDVSAIKAIITRNIP